jgi:hypothetical protein
MLIINEFVLKSEIWEQFSLWERVIRWENGLGGFERIFLFIFLLEIRAFESKNPFQSAESAQSVLPSYRPFPKQKLLKILIIPNSNKTTEIQNLNFKNNLDFQNVLIINTFRNPKSTIRNAN